MNSISRTFILDGDGPANALWAFLRNNWKAMASEGKPLAIRVSQHRASRSNEQNSLMWRWLTQIDEQAYVGGRRFDAEVWNQHAKEKLLPEETASGKRKWKHMPDGSRRLVLSTSDLNVEEMTAYLDHLAAYAATELGVTLT